MPSPALPLGISPEEFDKLSKWYKSNRASKDFALQRPPGSREGVPIPRWDDVIIIKPELGKPIEYLHYVGVDLGVIPIDSLSDDSKKAVMRRLLIAEKVRSENIPEWRQKMITAMTALDNAEDIISTMAWLFGPYLEKTGKVGKAIVVGAKGSSSAINFINKFLRGPELSRKAKHRYMDERKMNGRDRVMRNAPRSKAGKWLHNNLGNLIQAAQASQSVLGVGLQLGTIYGTLENAIWEDATTLKTVSELFVDRELQKAGFFYPSAQAIINKRIADNEKLLARQPEPWIKQVMDKGTANVAAQKYDFWIAQKIRDLVQIIKDNPLYEIETHGLALTAFNMWALMVKDSYGPALNGFDLQRVETLYTLPPRVWNNFSATIMRGYGIEFNEKGEGIGKARHVAVPLLEQARIDSADFLQHFGAWLPKNNDTDTNNFLNCQFVQAASVTGGMLTTTLDPLTIAKTLDEDLVFYSLDQAAIPPTNATQAEIATWATYMKAHCGPDLINWRRGGFQQMNRAYWYKLGRYPGVFNN